METTTRSRGEVRRRMSASSSHSGRARHPHPTEPLPRLLFTREESARILGMSLSHFQRYVQPYLRCVYSGSLRLYPPGELRRYIESRLDGTGVRGEAR